MQYHWIKFGLTKTTTIGNNETATLLKHFIQI